MKLVKKINIFFILIVFFSTVILGCGNSSNSSNEIRKGRYVETEYSGPEGIKEVKDLKKTKDGSIKLIGLNSGGECLLYSSNDMGKTWQKEKDDILKNNFEYEHIINNAEISENGDIVLDYKKFTKDQIDRIKELENQDEVREEEYSKIEPSEELIIIHEDGQSDLVNIKDLGITFINNIEINSKGDIFLEDRAEKSSIIYQLDKENYEIKHKYKYETGEIKDFCFLDNLLAIFSSNSVDSYNIKTGKKKEEIKALKDKTSASSIIISNNKDSLYYEGDKGVNSYKLKDKKIELIIHKDFSIIGDGDYGCNELININDKEFLGVFNNNTEDGGFKIVDFKYDKNADSKPKKEITLYSLYEEVNISKAIKDYQKKNKDVYIKYEVGVNYDTEGGKEEVTENDAIKTLNTEIMAGKGPDVIILDGLPYEEYIKKGILEDISNVIEMEKDNLFENITNAYKVDNKIYSYPLKVAVSRIVGRGMNEDVTDLISLTNAIEKMGSDKNKIINIYNSKELISYLYRSSSQSWIKDNKVNEEKVKEFLECCKKIYDKVIDSQNEKDKKNHEKMLNNTEESTSINDFYKESIINDYDCTSDIMFKSGPQFEIGAVGSMRELAIIKVAEEKYNINNNCWKGSIGNYFIPTIEVAVSNNSKDKDIANDFILSLLQKDFQKECDINGFSVNKTVLINNLIDKENYSEKFSFGSEEDDDEFVEIDLGPLSEEEGKEFLSEFESLDKKSIIDTTVYDKVVDVMAKYIDGKYDIESTIKDIKGNLEIYLSE